MSSLSDRLAAANRDGNREDANGIQPSTPLRVGDSEDRDSAHAEPERHGPRMHREKGRFDDLKASVHDELLQQLGPQLYDANLPQDELESKVRAALSDVMAATNQPLTATDRQLITQEIADDILGYGPL